ncbi:hypothetical protein ACG04Q_12035 [Roseateles sp. DXS20W]|uniref:Uncharacterized protein n=2 Tax=Pelomonas lactea TaxID=3299030 RepID=A0ABW7GK57_9BURK
MADLLKVGSFVGLFCFYVALFCVSAYCGFRVLLRLIDFAALIAFVRTAEAQGAKVWRWPQWAIRYSHWRHRR